MRWRRTTLGSRAGDRLNCGMLTSPRADSEPDADASKASPMIAQYLEIKAAHADCLLFYRMGDFYELFFADAEIAAPLLGIVLTRRGKHAGADIAMCGVPVDRADDYLHRLIAAGHRVAVCEQTEDPAAARKRGGKSVVRRAVVRLVTPGTVTEERLLDPARANCLLAVARIRQSDDTWTYGLAAVDISTGAFVLSETSPSDLMGEIGRLEPSEIVAPEALCGSDALGGLAADVRVPLTPLGRDGGGDGAAAERRILTFFGLATLEGLGDLSRAEIAAASTALTYIARTQLDARPPLDLPRALRRGSRMEIDAATRANLELTRTLAGDRRGSLLAAVDRCATPGGSRLLAERLAAPLTDIAAIGRRLDAVSFFVANVPLRGAVRAALKGIPDLARALGRLAMGRSGPRDLAALRDGLLGACAIAATMEAAGALPAELAQAVATIDAADPACARTLKAALAPDLPLHRRDGGFIARAHDPALDALRDLRDESRHVVAALQTRYAADTAMRQLKLKHNNVLGYFIEVPQASGERLLRPPHDTTFIHRQTMAEAMRFSTRELAELDAKITSAAGDALQHEQALYDAMVAAILAEDAGIKATAAALAAIDVASGLADVAAIGQWSRPEIEEGTAFAIAGGRHPVVEAALRAAGHPFIANDCDLSGTAAGGRIATVTGPNMAGKSTYLRQNALIAVLAQAGSFVPATSARIGTVDRLFSRVGAADDLARGRSTFMVEMVETAAILNQATMHSLVILDEIGRGTATFDGLSIAWAVMEHLYETNRARALFATHFHELTQLAEGRPRLVNLTVRVADWNGSVVFLHEIVAGAADRSYGIQVAKLAGLPSPVITRAKRLLADLEAGNRGAVRLTELPLFAAAAARPEPMSVAPSTDLLGLALDALEPDELSPKDAMTALYRLKAIRAAQT